MKLEIEKKHSRARAKILLVLLSVLCKLYVPTVQLELPVVAIPCACVEILARNRSPVASRSPPTTVLLKRSHTCVYYREMACSARLSVHTQQT